MHHFAFISIKLCLSKFAQHQHLFKAIQESVTFHGKELKGPYEMKPRTFFLFENFPKMWKSLKVARTPSTKHTFESEEMNIEKFFGKI